METLLSPIMDALRSCVCSALEDTMGGSVACSCSLMPGQEAPADWCQCNGRDTCGMAWVRLARMYPSTQRFPAQDGSTSGSCVTVLAAVLEVGAFRCQPAPKGTGQPPTPAEVTQATLTQMDDAMAMARAISCCEPITSRTHLLGTYEPRTSGGCGGGVWTVTVQLTRR